MTSASLIGLPTEILLAIFGHFCLHCCPENDPWDKEIECCEYWAQKSDCSTCQQRQERSWYSIQRQELWSACLVSRRLRDVAQPILFHEFAPGFGDSWRSDLYKWEGRLLAFVRALIRRPDLAASVKRVYLHPFILRDTAEEEAAAVVDEGICDLKASLAEYRAACHAAHPPSCAERGALIGLLIALLPNLKRLSVQASWPPYWFRYFNVPSSAMRALGVTGLPLKTVDIHGVQPKDVSGILELASGLTALNLYECRSFDQDVCWPSLNTLRLMDSRLNEEDLGRLLAACGDLRTFKYEAGPSWERDMRIQAAPGDRHFEPLDAARHLSKHRQTLKSLYLDLRGIDCLWPPAYPPIGSLKHFSALEDLFLSSGVATDWLSSEESGRLAELLPPNIESLELTAVRDQILIGLANAVYTGSFPRLRRVKEHTAQRDQQFPGGEMFACANVDCSLEKWPEHHRPLLFHYSRALENRALRDRA